MRKIAFDVVAMGELLIDFTENGLSQQGNPLFEANPGGAPCNLLAMLTRLGRRTAFLGKVGNDSFGRTLRNRVAEVGIDVSGLRDDPTVPTTLAFVHTQPGGDREFSFYRKPGADRMLREEELDLDKIAAAQVFHFGTLSMTDEPARSATYAAISFAKEQGCLLSFDPNLRPPLWTSEEEARRQIAYGLSQCDILKISDNEIAFMTGETEIEAGIFKLLEQYPIPLIFATMGKSGSKAFYQGQVVSVPSFLTSKTIETTGAGDTFGGCVLHFVLRYGLEHLTEANLREMLTFANAAASLITTRKGALCVMPEPGEVLAYMDSCSRA
ncbi:MAG: carbohydrate kinase [Lawsonibacter sp.]